MEHLQGNPNICLSGGASGADLEWGSSATRLGHKVVHWSFDGHETQAPVSQVVRLSDNQLADANDALVDAAAALGRRPPSRLEVLRLLQRNYFQVRWASSCYAVTMLDVDDGGGALGETRSRPGGTAWAMAMFRRLHPGTRELYVYDLWTDVWYQADRTATGWEPIEVPPRPAGLWAGIGSRDLRSNGEKAIRRLMSGDIGGAECV